MANILRRGGPQYSATHSYLSLYLKHKFGIKFGIKFGNGRHYLSLNRQKGNDHQSTCSLYPTCTVLVRGPHPFHAFPLQRVETSICAASEIRWAVIIKCELSFPLLRPEYARANAGEIDSNLPTRNKRVESAFPLHIFERSFFADQACQGKRRKFQKQTADPVRLHKYNGVSDTI